MYYCWANIPFISVTKGLQMEPSLTKVSRGARPFAMPFPFSLLNPLLAFPQSNHLEKKEEKLRTIRMCADNNKNIPII